MKWIHQLRAGSSDGPRSRTKGVVAAALILAPAALVPVVAQSSNWHGTTQDRQDTGQATRWSNPQGQQQSGTDQQSPGQAGQQHTVRGRLQHFQNMSLTGVPERHNLVRLMLADGQSALVDFGPWVDAERLGLERANQIEVQGHKTRIGSEEVLLARTIRVDGATTYSQHDFQDLPGGTGMAGGTGFGLGQERFGGQQDRYSQQPGYGQQDPYGQQRRWDMTEPGMSRTEFLTGRLESYQVVNQLPGVPGHHNLVLVRLDDGKRAIVNLGPQVDARRLNLAQAERLEVQGHKTWIGNEEVVLARTVRVDGVTTNVQHDFSELLMRPGGQDRWDTGRDAQFSQRWDEQQGRQGWDNSQSTQGWQSQSGGWQSQSGQGWESQPRQSWESQPRQGWESQSGQGWESQQARQQDRWGNDNSSWSSQSGQSWEDPQGRSREWGTSQRWDDPQMRWNARDMQSGQRSMEQEHFSGRLQSFERVQGLPGVPYNHTLVRMRLDDGRRTIVDLGPRIDPGRLDLGYASRVEVLGRKTFVGGEELLLAESLRVDGRTTLTQHDFFDIEQRPFASRRWDESIDSRDLRTYGLGERERISGRLRSWERVTDMPEVPRTHSLVRLRFEDGTRELVNLGPRVDPQRLELDNAGRVEVEGRRMRLGSEEVFLAETVHVDGQPTYVQHDFFDVREASAPRTSRQDSFGGTTFDGSTFGGRQPYSGDRGQGFEGQGMESFSGKLLSYQRVHVPGVPEHHNVIRLRMEDGRREIVNLGPRIDPNRLELREGRQLEVQGVRTTIGREELILADKVSVNGDETRIQHDFSQLMPLRGFTSGMGQATLSGTLQAVTQTSLEGAPAGHVLVRLRMQDGRSKLVDLGPRVDVEELRDASRVMIRGRETTISGQQVLLASEVEIDGRQLKLETQQRSSSGF